jgi:tRNA pseudouridine13 synthase
LIPVLYSKDDEQFVKTDLQKLMGEDKAADTAVADETPADKLSVIMRLKILR